MGRYINPDNKNTVVIDMGKNLTDLEKEMLLALRRAELDFNLLGIKEHAPMRKNLIDLIKKATE